VVEIRNTVREKLAAGELALGVGLRGARTVEIARAMKTAGFDWMFIDCEHSSMDLDTAAQIAAASLAVGITPVVRVPGYEHHHATRMLDNGAQGIVVPHVDDAAMAKRVADYCRFPPIGHRSMGGGLQQLGFVPMPVGEAARVVNEETLVVVMIESPQGVANAEAIAATPGIDALLIGTNDLCMEMGIPGKFDDPKVTDAYAKVIAACKKHGKYAGMGGLYSADYFERYIGMGVQLVLSGSDFSMLMKAASAQASLVRGFEK